MFWSFYMCVQWYFWQKDYLWCILSNWGNMYNIPKLIFPQKNCSRKRGWLENVPLSHVLHEPRFQFCNFFTEIVTWKPSIKPSFENAALSHILKMLHQVVFYTSHIFNSALLHRKCDMKTLHQATFSVLPQNQENAPNTKCCSKERFVK